MLVIESIATQKLEFSTRAGSKTIKQTMRNTIKKAIEDAILADIEEVLRQMELNFVIGRTGDDIVLAVENEVDEIEIPIQFGVKMKNLDFDTYGEIEMYEAEMVEKWAEAARKEAAKQAKIAADEAERAKKRAEKEKGE